MMAFLWLFTSGCEITHEHYYITEVPSQGENNQENEGENNQENEGENNQENEGENSQEDEEETEKSIPKSFAYGDTIHFIKEWSSDQYGPHCLNYFIARGDTKCQWGPWDYDGGNLADSYSSGTYTYRVTGENTATLTSTNRQSVTGRSWYMDIDLTFESYDKGTYECYEDPSVGNSHDLKGRFEISYNN